MSMGVRKGCPGPEEAPRMAKSEFFSNRSALWWAGFPIRVILAGVVFGLGVLIMPEQMEQNKATALELLEGELS